MQYKNVFLVLLLSCAISLNSMDHPGGTPLSGNAADAANPAFAGTSNQEREANESPCSHPYKKETKINLDVQNLIFQQKTGGSHRDPNATFWQNCRDDISGGFHFGLQKTLSDWPHLVVAAVVIIAQKYLIKNGASNMQADDKVLPEMVTQYQCEQSEELYNKAEKDLNGLKQKEAVIVKALLKKDISAEDKSKLESDLNWVKKQTPELEKEIKELFEKKNAARKYHSAVLYARNRDTAMKACNGVIYAGQAK